MLSCASTTTLGSIVIDVSIYIVIVIVVFIEISIAIVIYIFLVIDIAISIAVTIIIEVAIAIAIYIVGVIVISISIVTTIDIGVAIDTGFHLWFPVVDQLFQYPDMSTEDKVGWVEMFNCFAIEWDRVFHIIEGLRYFLSHSGIGTVECSLYYSNLGVY